MAGFYDLLLTAQTQKTPVKRVSGKDTEQFVREFFSDYTLKDRLRFRKKSSSSTNRRYPEGIGGPFLFQMFAQSGMISTVFMTCGVRGLSA